MLFTVMSTSACSRVFCRSSVGNTTRCGAEALSTMSPAKSPDTTCCSTEVTGWATADVPRRVRLELHGIAHRAGRAERQHVLTVLGVAHDGDGERLALADLCARIAVHTDVQVTLERLTHHAEKLVVGRAPLRSR